MLRIKKAAQRYRITQKSDGRWLACDKTGNGIGDNLVKQANDALEARELIKCRVLENSMLTAREAAEETGIQAAAAGCALRDWGMENIYTIYPQWRRRYAPGVCLNTERVFGLCVPAQTPVALNPREHTAYAWMGWREAADRCYSPSNAEAILWLPRFVGR